MEFGSDITRTVHGEEPKDIFRDFFFPIGGHPFKYKKYRKKFFEAYEYGDAEKSGR